MRAFNRRASGPRLAVRLAASTLVVSLCGGCATSMPITSADAAAGIHERRKEDIVNSFEQRRNESQYRAAMARWQRGDAAGCANMLQNILAREPGHKAARQSLADLYTERGNADAALRELKLLIEHHPNDAQAHNSLGLILDSMGRRHEAAKHLGIAVELDPQNKLYIMCLQEIAPTGS